MLTLPWFLLYISFIFFKYIGTTDKENLFIKDGEIAEFEIFISHLYTELRMPNRFVAYTCVCVITDLQTHKNFIKKTCWYKFT